MPGIRQNIPQRTLHALKILFHGKKTFQWGDPAVDLYVKSSPPQDLRALRRVERTLIFKIPS
jgi:hypothetical protein